MFPARPVLCNHWYATSHTTKQQHLYSCNSKLVLETRMPLKNLKHRDKMRMRVLAPEHALTMTQQLTSQLRHVHNS
jgi:hypothetical protein